MSWHTHRSDSGSIVGNAVQGMSVAAFHCTVTVSLHEATVVIGTAPGEWVTERPRLRFGFETEGITLAPGPRPTGYEAGTMGWFTDEPWFGFPGGGGMRTRVTGVVHREDERWKVIHLHFSVGVPDEEVQELQARWGVS